MERKKWTPNGFNTWEAISALQKDIRRCNPDKALYWLLELEGAGQLAWALNRLRAIGQEDVGIADMQAVMFAGQAIELAARFYKSTNEVWRVAAGNAILALCNAKKCRRATTLQAAVQLRQRSCKNGPKPPMPDYALDMHTATGKRMGRGIDHFLTDGAVLVDGSPSLGADPYEAEAIEFWRSPEAVGGQAAAGASKEPDLFG